MAVYPETLLAATREDAGFKLGQVVFSLPSADMVER